MPFIFFKSLYISQFSFPVQSCSASPTHPVHNPFSIISQLFGTVLAIVVALAGGFLVYGLLKVLIGIRLSQEEEFTGAAARPASALVDALAEEDDLYRELNNS